MGDFDDDGWQHMVCVEPGFVRENFALHPLQWLSLKQTLVIES
jgi:D-hexose-6-phosphate mutarotase